MATAIARGPLNALLKTSAGQYVVLGIGVYTLFPDQVQKLLEKSPKVLKYLVDSDDSDSASNSNKSSSPAPIVIYTPSPTVVGGNGMNNKAWITTVTYAAAGAGVCWAGYVVAVHLLPDFVGQVLPVTRSVFDKTAHSLGKGIMSVKSVLEEKILYLLGQQQELSKKQDETNKTVSYIKSELGETRIDLGLLMSGMDRCEDSMEKSEGMHQYTLRGVRLLVRCVASMIPDHGDIPDELARFIEEGKHQNLMGHQDAPATQSPRSRIVSRPTRRMNSDPQLPETPSSARTVRRQSSPPQLHPTETNTPPKRNFMGALLGH